MIGATGTGKTTLINRVMNYLFSVNYTDPFRFQLIEKTGLSKINQTQTTDIHKYIIHCKNFPYKVSIISIPGIYTALRENDNKKFLKKLGFFLNQVNVRPSMQYV